MVRSAITFHTICHRMMSQVYRVNRPDYSEHPPALPGVHHPCPSGHCHALSMDRHAKSENSNPRNSNFLPENAVPVKTVH